MAMVSTWMPLAVAMVALLGTVYTAWRRRIDEPKLESLRAQLQQQRDESADRREAHRIISRYREPLLQAAHDLQSRIYNALEKKFLRVYVAHGTELEREYAVENTVFLFAQFFGWTELIRSQLRFIELDSDDETRQLRQNQDRISSILRTDSNPVFGNRFRVFFGQQRGIGELMILHDAKPPSCMGYAGFQKSVDPLLKRWLDPLRESIDAVARDDDPSEARLVDMQHALIDLVRFLDPNGTYYPNSRSLLKIGRPRAAVADGADARRG